MLNKYIAVFLCSILFSYSALAGSQNDAAALVTQMYKDYAFEAVIVSPFDSSDSLINATPEVLSKYFDEQLVSAIVKDRSCGNAICNLDFNPIWDSMDPSGASVVVKGTKNPEVVLVEVIYFNGKGVLTYRLKNTSAGWRIIDVDTYKGSLIRVLSKPID